jgi:hypothetical protein
MLGKAARISRIDAGGGKVLSKANTGMRERNAVEAGQTVEVIGIED